MALVKGHTERSHFFPFAPLHQHFTAIFLSDIMFYYKNTHTAARCKTNFKAITHTEYFTFHNRLF